MARDGEAQRHRRLLSLISFRLEEHKNHIVSVIRKISLIRIEKTVECECRELKLTTLQANKNNKLKVGSINCLSRIGLDF